MSVEDLLKEKLGKGIAEASDREIYIALLNIAKEKMQGMEHNEKESCIIFQQSSLLESCSPTI